MSEPQAPATDLAVAMQQVAVLLKLAQVYQADNAMLAAPVQAVVELVRRLGELTVVSMADSFFINGALVRLKPGFYEHADGLRRTLQRLGAQEIGFASTLDEAALRDFLGQLQTALRGDVSQLAATLTGAVRLRSLQGSLSTGGPSFAIDARQNLLRAFARLTISTQEMLTRLEEGKPFRTPALRKAVQGLAEASVGYESLLAGLTRFPNFQGQAHSHLSTVAALVLLMARRLGLTRAALVETVLAALMHDTARRGVERFRDDPARAEAEAVRTPVATLLELGAAGDTEALVQAAVAFEVALPAWQTGPLSPGVLARLIAVPCAFDLLTSARPPRRPVAPDQALRVLHDQSGTRFDPRVVRLFTATIGLYPVGTTVRLSGGQLAIVVEVPLEARDFLKPVVKVIRDESGAVDRTVDLAHEPGLHITGSVDAVEQGVNPPHFLLA